MLEEPASTLSSSTSTSTPTTPAPATPMPTPTPTPTPATPTPTPAAPGAPDTTAGAVPPAPGGGRDRHARLKACVIPPRGKEPICGKVVTIGGMAIDDGNGEGDR